MEGENNSYAKEKLSLKASILKIVEKSYERKSPLIQARIVEKLIEYKNKDLLDSKYEFESIQPSTSRALKQMVQAKQLLKLPDKSYIPFDISEARKQIAIQIMEEIQFNREEIFCLSPAVILLDVHPKSISKAKELFEQYLGQKNCYDIIDFQGYLMLMMLSVGKDEKDLAQLTQDIRKIVIESCNR